MTLAQSSNKVIFSSMVYLKVVSVVVLSAWEYRFKGKYIFWNENIIKKEKVIIEPYWLKNNPILWIRKVVSTDTSPLEAHSSFYILLMKGIFSSLVHSRLKCLGGVPVLWSKWPLASSLLRAIKTCRQACPPGYLMHFS